MMSLCKHCGNPVNQDGPAFHRCINRLWLATYDGKVIAHSTRLQTVANEMENHVIDLRNCGLLPDVPWSAR